MDLRTRQKAFAQRGLQAPRDLVVLLRRVVVREQGRREEQRAHDGEGAGEEAAAWFVLPHRCDISCCF